MERFWQELHIEEAREYNWIFYHTRINALKNTDEWHVSLQYLANDPVHKAGADDIEWHRFISDGKNSKLMFTPLPPDKPVLVNPEQAVNILPGQKARFFIRMPVWLEISLFTSKRIPILETALEKLTNTWFGSSLEGFLCYKLNTLAKRDFRETGDSQAPSIITPVLIRNESHELLAVQDVCIHAENLRVYRGVENLWTNEIGISFYGNSQPSKVSYGDKKPRFEELREETSSPRIRVKQDILSKSFSFLKNISS